MIDATPLLRRLAARRLGALAAQDAEQAQRATLRRLLRRAAGTRFGREHGFADIGSVEAYQARVPLRRYEDFWRNYWQPAFPLLRDITWPGLIPFFALSSGTSGGPTKHIPLTRAMLRANAAAGFDTLAFHLAARPRSAVFGGRNFLLGGATALHRHEGGIRSGDLSGIVAATLPALLRARAYPPRRLALIADWEAKIAALAPQSLRRDIRSISGTPSWLLLFFDRLASLHPDRPRRLAAFYPNLELVVHGGVGFAPYREAFAGWLQGSHAETREVYPASEGFIAAADGAPDAGLRLLADRGLFFEFVPPDQLDHARPDRRWLATAEPGVDYALVLSSAAGLWSYVLGDTVVLTQRAPPRLRITGRTSFTLSAFGEHLTGQELDAAIAQAARDAATTAIDYAAAALPPDAAGRGQHVFVVELAAGADAARFAHVLDDALQRLNADYAAHRAGDYGVRLPEVRLAPPGTFAAWMRARGKLGGQHKVPRVINDPALLASLLARLPPAT